MEESSPSLRNNLFVCLDKEEKFIQLTAREREPVFCLSLKDLETHSFFIFFQARYWPQLQTDLSEAVPVPSPRAFRGRLNNFKAASVQVSPRCAETSSSTEAGCPASAAPLKLL